MDRRSEEDNRKIERVSIPSMRSHFRQINMCLRFLTVLLAGGMIYVLVRGFTGAANDLTYGIFLAILLSMLAIFVFRYSQAIQYYLENESHSNLDRAMERQSVFWVSASFLGFLYTIVYFLFR